MRSTLAALCLLGLAVHGPVSAQEFVWGPPLVDGLGGPLGYGEPHDGISEVPIDAAASNGMTFYDTTVDALFVNWIGSISLGFIYPQYERRSYPREDFLHGIRAVHYPGLPDGDPDGLVGRQLEGPGTMLAFEVEGGYDAARAVVEAVELMTPAVSLGSVDTLIQHPAGLTHRVLSEDARTEGGIAPGLLRLSVGLETADDLWADLHHALAMSMKPSLVTQEPI